LHVDFVRQRLQTVVGLRDAGRGKGVGFDEVGAGLEVLRMNRGDVVRPCQYQQVAVALQVVRVIFEPAAAELGVGQLQALDHRAHCAIQHEDARREQIMEKRCRIVGHNYLFCRMTWV
jgi:hypothetical protein